MKRPESALAMSLLGLVGAMGVLVAVSMTSCQSLDLGQIGGEGQSTKPDPNRKPGGKSVAKTAGGDKAIPTRDVPRTVGEPDLRVRILTAVDTVSVQSPGGMRVAIGDPRGLAAEPINGVTWPRAELIAMPVSVSLKGGQWTLTGALGEKAIGPATADAALLIAPANETQGIGVNGQVFSGVLRLVARTDVRPGMFEVVEFVGLEDYLPGVVAKEMMSNWPLEAYRAQAVAARTYAMQERERSIGAGQPFDLESSDKDQVYSGSTTNRTAIQAVQSTRGQVLFDGDKVLRAYFSSTCGGRTAAAKDTWPTGPGYEYNLAGPIQAYTRPHACDKSPLYRWTVERTRKEMVARLRTFGEKNQLMVRQIKDLKAIEPMALNADGRPCRYKIIQTDGKWFQLSGEELRLACNTSVNGSGGGIPVPGGAPMASANPPVAMSSAPSSGESFPDIDRKTRVNSSDIDIKVVGEKVTITGRGFGHGVGLCQYCAKSMADRGDDYRVMVMRFYPGALLKQAY